jgi:hypothetical protein
MSRSVRNALLFVGLVASAWVLLVLAGRVARWLLTVTVWLIVLAVTGAILLSHVVTQRFPPWNASLRSRMAPKNPSDQSPASTSPSSVRIKSGA